MLNRRLLAAVALAVASSAVFAAPASKTQVVEGKDPCTTTVEGTARQTAELEASKQYRFPRRPGLSEGTITVLDTR